MAESVETERLMRSARVRCRTIMEALEKGEHDEIIKQAYNIMYMSAKATLNHLGADANNHRQVASLYRKELAGKRLIDRKYQDHLRKIHLYREEMMEGKFDLSDKEKLEAIVTGTREFVEMMSKLIKKHPEPIINYDLSDYA